MKTAIGSYEIRLYICMLIIDEGQTETFYSQILNDMGGHQPACSSKLNVKERELPFLN